MPMPALYTIVDGFLVTPSHLVAIALGLAALVLVASLALPLFAADRERRQRRHLPPLRLIPTANAWGYSERATLDESAVGL